jgi:flagellar hook-associated protein 3 FlgL
MPFSQANANPTTPAVVTTPVTNITTAATDTTALAVDPAIVDSTLVDPAAAATVNTPVSAFTYFGSNTQRSIQIGTGRTITDGDTGTATFTSAKTGLTLFDTVKNFATELRADKPTLETLQALDDAFTQISTVRSNVGARINALDRQKTTNQDFIINNQTALSQIEDLDYATAITTLNTQQNSLQAAQQSYAKVQGMSLFKYL